MYLVFAEMSCLIIFRLNKNVVYWEETLIFSFVQTQYGNSNTWKLLILHSNVATEYFATEKTEKERRRTKDRPLTQKPRSDYWVNRLRNVQRSRNNLMLNGMIVKKPVSFFLFKYRMYLKIINFSLWKSYFPNDCCYSLNYHIF